ncbi:MAG: hypothetical protein H0X24_01275 [Ktedonobacterales bacterium]|nr:hypothetical protein [Ktedonobacterales bacterium]
MLAQTLLVSLRTLWPSLALFIVLAGIGLLLVRHEGDWCLRKLWRGLLVGLLLVLFVVVVPLILRHATTP